mgnify:CR=1 FL=1
MPKKAKKSRLQRRLHVQTNHTMPTLAGASLVLRLLILSFEKLHSEFDGKHNS